MFGYYLQNILWILASNSFKLVQLLQYRPTGASSSFDWGKQMISNVPEGFDGVDKLSYEQTSGIFNFNQRN